MLVADCSLAESISLRRQGVVEFFISHQFRRIYYPTNKEEPTPALPKGGSLNEAQYSLTTNRLTSNGRFPPPFGKGYG